MSALHWSSAYIGIPWVSQGRDHSGADCYGLARLVLLEQAGIVLSAHVDAAATLQHRPDLASTVDDIASTAPWLPVAAPGQELDVAVFRLGQLARHIGVIVGAGRMLHVAEDGESCLTRLDESRWQSRFLGLVRHQALAEGRA